MQRISKTSGLAQIKHIEKCSHFLILHRCKKGGSHTSAYDYWCFILRSRGRFVKDFKGTKRHFSLNLGVASKYENHDNTRRAGIRRLCENLWCVHRLKDAQDTPTGSGGVSPQLLQNSSENNTTTMKERGSLLYSNLSLLGDDPYPYSMDFDTGTLSLSRRFLLSIVS